MKATKFEMPRAEIILMSERDVITESNEMDLAPLSVDDNVDQY